MKRTIDPTNLNTVVNHPEVRPWVKGPDGPLDVTSIVTNPFNFVFEVPGGGFICINTSMGVYEVHSQFAPEARRYSLQTMKSAMDYMFTRTDCTTLVSHFPDGNPMADAIGRKGGFKFHGTRMEEPPFGPCEIRTVILDDWVAENDRFEAEGEAFHTALEQAKIVTGSELPVHDHDPVHERFVGATITMAKRGNVIKGVDMYNRWCAGSGYAPITLLGINPPLVDVVHGIVGLTEAGELDVLLVR
jgi:hypothetical protein